MTEERNNYQLATLIIKESAAQLGVKESALRGRRRSRHIARARNLAMFLIRRGTQLSLSEIGRLFNRHHTTVLSACESVRRASNDTAEGDWALVGVIQVRRAVERELKGSE